MIKKIIFVTFLFIGLSSFGQDINELRKKASSSSDSELVVFIQKAKDQGLSLMDAEKQLILIGGKADEIQKLRDLWKKKLPKKSETDLDDTNKIESQFGETEGFVKDSLSQDVEDEVKRFGSDFFKNKNIVESPQLFVATPSDYRLGPGDDLIINLFGASEITYSVQISRNGNVKFDKLAPVYLSGLSIRSASKRLKERLSKIYTGLNSNNPIEKVDLELSLQKARSIVINITGQVEAPGTYTISGFSSVLNALYAAGGPNDVGTYRDINIIRNGRIVHNVDLYDYFSNGIFPNIYLRDQDVILVKPLNIETELVSGFKQLALFEMKKDEVVSDLINLSGGASSNTYKSKLFIERFDDFSQKIVEIDEINFKNAKLNDGDKISFKEINNENISGAVKIGGAVYLSGNFQLENNKSVNDLINSAKGLSNDLLGDNAILYRSNKGLENRSISINLKDNDDLSTQLFENDSLYIPSSKDILFDQFIEIKGEVNFPKEIDFLEENGYQCQHEISRQVTLEAKKKGIDQLFLSDPILFSQLLLKGRLQQHQEVDHFKKTILFYDRGLPDVTAYMDFTNVSYPESFHTTCNKYRYGTVFILPPWKDIYIQDNERYETYEEAEKIHKVLTQSYQKYGYEVIEVPFGTLEERMKFMITHLEI